MVAGCEGLRKTFGASNACVPADKIHPGFGNTTSKIRSHLSSTTEPTIARYASLSGGVTVDSPGPYLCVSMHGSGDRQAFGCTVPRIL